MPQDIEYAKKVYGALKGELGDAFTKTEDEFMYSIDNEEGYSDKVYAALKGELGDSFTKTQEEFSSLIKKKVETEVGSEVSQSLETPTISDEDKYLSDLTPEQRASAEKHGYTQEIINQRKKKEKYVISEEDKAFSKAMIASLDEKKKSVESKLSDEYTKTRGNVPNLFRGVAYGGTAVGYPADISTPELTKMRSEIKYINRAKDYLEVVAKGDEETAIKRFWRGLRTTDVTNAFTAGLSQMADDAQILALTNKLQNKGIDAMSEDEKGILLLKNISDYSQQLASKDRSFAVGSGVAESIPFMTAMLLTGGAGEATNVALKGASTSIYRKLLANVGEAGVRALMMPSTYGGTMERMTSDTDMDLQIAEEGEKLPEAFAKSLGAKTVETFSEVAVGKWIEGGMAKLINKANASGTKLFKGSKFGEIMDAASAGVKGSKALQAMSIQDPISEFGEEVFSGVVTPLITRDGTPADFFEAENMIRTALITGVMSTSMRALSQVAGIRDYKMIQKGMSGYNSLTDEQKQLFNEAVDTDDVDTSTKKIVDLISASDNVEDAKKQPSLISYARSIIRAKKQATDALGKDKTPTYQIGNKVFTEKANFEKEYNKQKNEGNLQPIKINNDEVTATQIDNDLRGGIVDNPTVVENVEETIVEEILADVPDNLKESVSQLAERPEDAQLSVKEQQIAANYSEQIKQLRDNKLKSEEDDELNVFVSGDWNAILSEASEAENIDESLSAVDNKLNEEKINSKLKSFFNELSDAGVDTYLLIKEMVKDGVNFTKNSLYNTYQKLSSEAKRAIDSLVKEFKNVAVGTAFATSKIKINDRIKESVNKEPKYSEENKTRTDRIVKKETDKSINYLVSETGETANRIYTEVKDLLSKSFNGIKLSANSFYNKSTQKAKELLDGIVKNIKKIIIATAIVTSGIGVNQVGKVYSASDIADFANRQLNKMGIIESAEDVIKIEDVDLSNEDVSSFNSYIDSKLNEQKKTIEEAQKYRKENTSFNKLAKTSDGLWSFRRQWFNEDGGVYVTGVNNENFRKQGKKTSYSGVEGVAHHMIMRGVANDLTDATNDKDLRDASKKIIESANDSDYIPVFERGGNGKVRLIYKLGSDLKKNGLGENEVSPVRLRQTTVGDLDFGKTASAEGFKSNIKAVYQKSTGKGFNSLVYRGDKNAYGKFSGGSPTFIFKDDKGNVIVREYTGSINGIQNEIKDIKNRYGVSDSDITIGFYDAGSYTGKTSAINGNISPSKWYGYNPDAKAGSSLMIPTKENSSFESRDIVLDALNWLVDATELDSGKLYSNPLAIPQSMLNASFKIIRATYKVGKDLAKSINEGIKYLESMGYKVDKTKYIEHVRDNINKKQEENAKKNGTSIEETMQEEGNVEGEMQRLHIRNNEEAGMETEKPKEQVARKKETAKIKEKKTFVPKLKETYRKSVANITDAKERNKIAKSSFGELTKNYKPEKSTPKYSLKTKDLKKKVASGSMSFAEAADEYIRMVDEIELSRIKASTKAQLRKPLKSESSKQKMKALTNAIYGSSGILARQRAQNKDKRQFIKDYADGLLKADPTLSKSEAKKQAESKYNTISGGNNIDINKQIAEELRIAAEAKGGAEGEALSYAADIIETLDAESIESMSEFHETVRDIIESTREDLKSKAQQKREVKEALNKEYDEAVRPELEKKLEEKAGIAAEEGKVGSKIERAFRKVQSLNMTLESLGRLISKEGSAIDKTIQKIIAAAKQRTIGRNNATEAVWDLMTSIYGIEKGNNATRNQAALTAKETELKHELVTFHTADGKPIRSSKATVMKIWGWLQNADTRELLLKNGQFSEATMQEIEDSLTEQDKQFVRGVMDIMSEYGDKIEQIARSKDIKFKKVPNYLSREVDLLEKELDSGTTNNVNSLLAGMMNERSSHIRDLKIEGVDIFRVLDRYVRAADMIINNSYIEEEVKTLLNNKKITKIVKGLGMEKDWTNLIRQSMGYAIYDKNNTAAKINNALAGGITKGALWGRITQIPKQIASYAAGMKHFDKYAEGNDAKKTIDFLLKSHLALAQYGKKRAFFYEHSPMFRARVNNWYRANVDADLPEGNWKKVGKKLFDAIDQWNAIGMLSTKHGDLMGIIMGYSPVYDAVLEKTGSHEKAIEAFEEYDRTQQSQNMANRTLAQENPYMKMLTMFKSSQTLYWNETFRSLKNIRDAYKEGGIKNVNRKDVYNYLLFRNVLNGMFQLVDSTIGALISDDDKDDKVDQFWKEMLRSQLLGNLNAMVYLAEIGSNGINLILGEKIFQGTSPTDLSFEAMQKAGSAYKAFEKGDNEKAVRQAVDAAAKAADFTGVSASNAIDITEGIIDALQGKEWKEYIGEIMLAPESKRPETN